MTRSLLARYWGITLVVVMTAVVFVFGLRALNFGYHWDEPVHFAIVKNALADQTFLPDGFYHYPSLTFALTVVARLSQRAMEPLGYGQGDLDFYLLGRGIFMGVTLLGGPLLYFAARRLGTILAGVVAASVYLLSWQLDYHSRWIAPDALLAAATCAFIWALALRWRPDARTFIALLPAMCAGVAAGSKYQGAVLLLPALVATVVWARRDGKHFGSMLKSLLGSIGAFAVVFVVITPGSVIQPLKFIAAIIDRSQAYKKGNGTHLGAESETIRSPVEYGVALLRATVLDLPSFWLLGSIAISLVALVGLVWMWRSDTALAVTLLVGPLALFLYSLTLVVFIIRNFLLFLPFTALFAGLGASALYALARSRIGRIAVGAVIGVWITASTLDMAAAAQSVADRGPAQIAAQIASRIAASTECLRPSTKVMSLLESNGHPITLRPQAPHEPANVLVLWRQLTPGAPVTLVQWPGTASRWFDAFGSREVDFSFYPRWSGEDRGFEFTQEQLNFLGIDDSELAALEVTDSCAVITP